MCNGCCPPQKVNLDAYLDGYFLCGMSAAEIGRRLNVSKMAVTKGLKCYDPEAYRAERARRKRENVEIRRRKDRERKRTPEAREKDRERKRRERFLGTSYIKAVQQLLRDPEVLAVMRRALREMNATREQRTFAMLLPPIPQIPHPVPHEAKDPIYTTPSEAAGRATYEIRISSRILFGVPGPAILRIREALDSFNLGKAIQLAREAVRDAGFVNPETTVGYVLQQTATIDPNTLPGYYDQVIQDARDWAPALEPETPPPDVLVRRWYAQARAAERESRRVWYGTCGTGKKGKGGGLQNVATRQKWDAVR
ncbi:MAG: hypothetical protein H0Z39_07190 [Peptococcaceae bacterium]|nr:hypothetical protein [Peptococcaceae bacterium]